MRILMRVDAGVEAGMGHLMECKVLADHLRREYAIESIFVVSQTCGWLRDTITEEFLVEQIHTAALQREVAEIRDVASKYNALVIVCNLAYWRDGYLEGLKSIGMKTIVIRELETGGKGDLDINVSLKPQYMILHPVFAELRSTYAVRQEVREVFVSFGGSDPYGLTLHVLSALSLLKRRFSVNVVVGAHFRFNQKLHRICDCSKREVHVWRDISIQEVARVMHDSDVAVTAGGNMMYELATLGVPSVILPPTKKQESNAAVLRREGAVVLLGTCPVVSEEEIARAVGDLIDNALLRTRLSRIARQVVDGRGVVRVSKKITDMLRNTYD